MPKRLLAWATSFSGAYQLKQFDLGQGVEPAVTPLLANSSWGIPSSYPVIVKSFNDDFMLMPSGGGSSVAGCYYFTDPFDLRTYATLKTPVFSGTIYAAAASSAYFAIGGNNPFLYVLSRSDLSLKTVSTAGLGQVFAIDFSPDGSLMAVYHSTAPYLRVYKTSDWTYTNAAPAVQPGLPPASVKGMAFSSDGTKIVVSTNAAPYLNVYNATTLARLFTGAPTGNGGGQVIASRLNNNEVFIAISNVSSPCAAKLNLNTYALTMASGAPNINGYSIALDEVERILYVSTDNSGEVWTRRFNADTMAELPVVMDTVFQYLRTPTTALAIIEKTPHVINGTVRDIDNNPAAREILAFDRDTARLVARTISNASTGDYQLRTSHAGPFDIQFKILGGEQLNDLFYARVEAQPV